MTDTVADSGIQLRPPARPLRASQLYLLKSHRFDETRPGDRLFVGRGRQDIEPFRINLPLDWNADPVGDRNWCGQLHMWRMMDDPLLHHDATGDATWLQVPLALVDDWHRHHVAEGLPSTYAWSDMMVGMRAMKLAYLASAHFHGRIAIPQAQLDRIAGLVARHLDFLLDPAKLAYSNHTFFDLHGAAALAQLVDDATRARIEAFVDEHLPRLLASQFNAHGMHLEHSPEYLPFAIKAVQRLHATGWFGRHALPALMRRAQAMQEWLKLPDGRPVPVGDTTAQAAPVAPPALGFSGTQVLNNGGYAIVRSDNGGRRARDASYLLMMGGFHSRFHKHSDDLSLVWFEGEDLLCDAGKYAYRTDEQRDYVLSTRAHNTVEFDGANSWDYSYGAAPPAYGSAIELLATHGWGQQVVARVEQKRSGVTHLRSVMYRPSQWLLVVDQFVAAKAHDCVQWWHFAPALELAESGDGLACRTRGGRQLRIASAATEPLQVQRLRGETAPRLQGWTSLGYRQLEPAWALGVGGSFDRGAVATLFTLDADDARLRHADGRFIMSARVAGDAMRLVVTPGANGCRVRVRD